MTFLEALCEPFAITDERIEAARQRIRERQRARDKALGITCTHDWDPHEVGGQPKCNSCGVIGCAPALGKIRPLKCFGCKKPNATRWIGAEGKRRFFCSSCEPTKKSRQKIAKEAQCAHQEV